MNNFIQEFLKSKLKIKQFCKENNLDVNNFSTDIAKLGYIVSTKQSGETIYKVKEAIEVYKHSKRTHGQVARKFNISAITLKAVLEKLNIFDSNRITKKYNEHVFDSIDTEEKAYWLGYIYADGYIYNLKPRSTGQIDYNFELCTKGNDMEHMEKFARFISLESKLKVTKADNKGHTRCRVCLSSKHLWETLNSYGCTPKKSLTLQFPDESIFKDKSLIRHFIRGYFDGDGCISFGNKKHTQVNVYLLGTYSFLERVLQYSNTSATLHHNHNNDAEITMSFQMGCKKAFNFINYLYLNSNIYLQRKFDRYYYFCRLYEESHRGSEGKNGEDCDVNTVLNSEITKGSESV